MATDPPPPHIQWQCGCHDGVATRSLHSPSQAAVAAARAANGYASGTTRSPRKACAVAARVGADKRKILRCRSHHTWQPGPDQDGQPGLVAPFASWLGHAHWHTPGCRVHLRALRQCRAKGFASGHGGGPSVCDGEKLSRRARRSLIGQAPPMQPLLGAGRDEGERVAHVWLT